MYTITFILCCQTWTPVFKFRSTKNHLLDSNMAVNNNTTNKKKKHQQLPQKSSLKHFGSFSLIHVFIKTVLKIESLNLLRAYLCHCIYQYVQQQRLTCTNIHPATFHHDIKNPCIFLFI